MPKLSKEKLNTLKESKCFTSKEIAKKTGIPISTISKIFGGFNTNPTLANLQKIAQCLNCAIDDFIDYENEPIKPYYTDRQTAMIVQTIHENPNLKLLLEISKDLSADDLKAIIDIVIRIKKAQ